MAYKVEQRYSHWGRDKETLKIVQSYTKWFTFFNWPNFETEKEAKAFIKEEKKKSDVTDRKTHNKKREYRIVEI